MLHSRGLQGVGHDGATEQLLIVIKVYSILFVFQFSCSIGSDSARVCVCLTHCDPVNRSTTGLPVHHKLPESTQTHVHRVSDAIQPSHPLSAPSALSLSQHHGLFQ